MTAVSLRVRQDDSNARQSGSYMQARHCLMSHARLLCACTEVQSRLSRKEGPRTRLVAEGFLSTCTVVRRRP